MDMKGHDVKGYDINPLRMTKKPQPYQEAGPDGTGDFNDYLWDSNLRFACLEETVLHGELIFTAIQTPHEFKFEGCTPIPDERSDFDYTWLQSSLQNIENICAHNNIRRTVIVISTCLPGIVGPMAKKLKHLDIIYNPFFIAMGTTMRDFLHPEFILIGEGNGVDSKPLVDFYRTITDAPAQVMSIASAELTKVAYNTYIGTKIAFANTVMEICDLIPDADCDSVIDALSKATTRLISPAYLRGGMGDGGGCHPRDNIAMSWLAENLDLSHNIFDDIMMCREDQSKYLVDLVDNCMSDCAMTEVVVLGYAFKPETNLTIGSPARLLMSQLCAAGYSPLMMDPVVEGRPIELSIPAIYIIGCKHKEFSDYKFPTGSIVIDPHRYIPDQKGVIVYRIGEARECDPQS
jgi:UDPglucose 6-dehydrogenase